MCRIRNEHVRASVVGEIVATKDFYSYDAKYISSTGAKLQIPAEINAEISGQIIFLWITLSRAYAFAETRILIRLSGLYMECLFVPKV